jgi:NAD(P)-dependent dehydrogenase (short-subunit alcohol dehydrogenase family)
MGQLANRHAVITGGGSGIGAAIARALANEGARITVAGRRQAPLDQVAAALPVAAAVVADVTRETDCASMIEAAREAHGPVDIVVANAGMAESAPAGKLDLAQWQRSIDVNLTGAFLTVRAALSDLTRNPSSEGRRIIFVASTAGIRGYAYVTAYCAAKHGVVGLARALSVELAASGVTVNAVCPGYTETPMLEAAVAKIAAKTGRSAQTAREELIGQNPHGRLIKPEEVAQAVLWLCSPAAASINGQAIVISGGQT